MLLASAPPPMEPAPTPSLSGVVEVETVDFSPQIAIPDFSTDKGRVWRVCEGCEHTSLSQALATAQDGDTIRLAPGLYTDCVKVIKKSIAIVGEIGEDGTRATFNRACAGKAAFNLAGAFARLEGIQVQDIAVADRNGACVRLQPRGEASLVVHLRNIICVRSENGVLGGAGPSGALIVESSLFVGNGKEGRAHGIYMGNGREFVFRDSVVHSTKDGGHSLKIGAQRALIVSSIVAALDGDNSRAIDFFGGGVLYVNDSVLQQGPRSDNHDMIGLLNEVRRMNRGVPHAVYVRDSWLIYDDENRCCRWLLSGRKSGDILFEGNRMVAINGSRLTGYETRDNKRVGNRAAAGLAAYDATLEALPKPAAW
ncbi:MAG: hypothetical protein AAGA68_14545 [Pseudomonadota bacterium]